VESGVGEDRQQVSPGPGGVWESVNADRQRTIIRTRFQETLLHTVGGEVPAFQISYLVIHGRTVVSCPVQVVTEGDQTASQVLRCPGFMPVL
jgi:hypothetical protein